MQSILQQRRFARQIHKLVHADGEETVQAPAATARPSESSLDTSSEVEVHERPQRLHTIATARSTRTAFGYSLDGISARERTTKEGKNGHVFVVSWDGPDDPLKPMNFSTPKRLAITLCVALIAVAVTAASSIDSAIAVQAARTFHVSDTAEALATGMFLIGFALGSFFSGPLSETFGRNLVYFTSNFFLMIWEMGAALAPNFAAQIIFRFLAGFFASPPLTVAGGTIADVWNSAEKAWAFPLYAITAFAGPVLGPVIGAYLGIGDISWRWSEWLMVIFAGGTLLIVAAFQPETYAPVLLAWKAKELRKATGDDRYRAESEIVDATLFSRLKIALSRPFQMVVSELIIILMTLYLTVVYIVLFTFLDGYSVIFGEVYGINQGLTNLIFLAMFVGITIAWVLVPIVSRITSRKLVKVHAKGQHAEVRLWYAMLGAPAMPISLFWLAWTCYVSNQTRNSPHKFFLRRVLTLETKTSRT